MVFLSVKDSNVSTDSQASVDSRKSATVDFRKSATLDSRKSATLDPRKSAILDSRKSATLDSRKPMTKPPPPPPPSRNPIKPPPMTIKPAELTSEVGIFYKRISSLNSLNNIYFMFAQGYILSKILWSEKNTNLGGKN